jgi:hypothetical protein
MSPFAGSAAEQSGSVEISGSGGGLVLLLLLLGALVVAVVATTRPWELRGGALADKLRIADAAMSYDFWLGLQGVGWRARRAAVAELRSNLWEASRSVGAKEAIRALGPLRVLARESVPDTSGPRWGHAAVVGVVALEVVVVVQLLLMTVVVDTAQAAEVDRVDVPVTVVPGMSATYEATDDTLSFGVGFGPAPLVVGLVAFVLAARPWRLVRRARPAVA